MRMAAEYGEVAITSEENSVRSIREQWCVEYSRFFHYPQLSSTHYTLTPLSSNHRARLRGTWIASSSDCLASITLLNSPHSPVILLVTFRHKILEEHYISKLHFMWPQMTCVSGYPARASRVVLLSYGDNEGQIHKFALRFLTIYDTEKFIKTLQEILEEESVPGPTPNILGSATSSQSECVPPSVSPYRPIKDCGPKDTYPHDLTLSLNLESPKEKNIPRTIQNHQGTMENDQVEGIFSDYPPSFSSLLMNCYSIGQQAVAEPTATKDAELKAQIAKYLEDASFQDMLIKVEQVINEIGDDMMLQ